MVGLILGSSVSLGVLGSVIYRAACKCKDTKDFIKKAEQAGHDVSVLSKAYSKKEWSVVYSEIERIDSSVRLNV